MSYLERALKTLTENLNLSVKESGLNAPEYKVAGLEIFRARNHRFDESILYCFMKIDGLGSFCFDTTTRDFENLSEFEREVDGGHLRTCMESELLEVPFAVIDLDQLHLDDEEAEDLRQEFKDSSDIMWIWSDWQVAVWRVVVELAGHGEPGFEEARPLREQRGSEDEDDEEEEEEGAL